MNEMEQRDNIDERKTMDKILATPVLFVIFNRPDTTQRVFDEIRKAKPTKLFVASDGPRADREGEAEKCEAARDIIKQVDWDCEVHKLFRDENLGCKIAVSSAIDWFLSEVEEGIILEDDCVPHPTFFRFCQELLERYRHDERVFVITGDNFLFGRRRSDYSYYFSRYNHCWGWATWRRAWLHYDGEMRYWPEIKNGKWLRDILGHSAAVKYWLNMFQRVHESKIDSWAFPWTFSCWIQSGLTVIPNMNLVSNIGYGVEATHTKGTRSANMAVTAMDFPLRHPPFVIRDTEADDYTQRTHFGSGVILRILSILLRIMRRIGLFRPGSGSYSFFAKKWGKK